MKLTGTELQNAIKMYIRTFGLNVLKVYKHLQEDGTYIVLIQRQSYNNFCDDSDRIQLFRETNEMSDMKLLILDQFTGEVKKFKDSIHVITDFTTVETADCYPINLTC